MMKAAFYRLNMALLVNLHGAFHEMTQYATDGMEILNKRLSAIATGVRLHAHERGSRGLASDCVDKTQVICLHAGKVWSLRPSEENVLSATQNKTRPLGPRMHGKTSERTLQCPVLKMPPRRCHNVIHHREAHLPCCCFGVMRRCECLVLLFFR